MNIEDIKDQMRERGQELWSQIEESNLYITLRERYDSLPPLWQKTVAVLAVLFGLYIVLSIPQSFVAASSEHEEFFIENRLLTRDLIRAGRLAQTVRTPPPAPSFSSLQGQVQASLARHRVLDEQRRNIIQIQNVADKKLVPKGINQTGLKLGAQKLNLKQAIEVAEDIAKLNSSKLINMSMQADAQDPHYFSVDYEMATFSIPFDAEPAGKGGKGKRGRRGKKKK